MKKLPSFVNRIRSGYLLSFLLLSVSYFLIFYLQQRMTTVNAWMIDIHSVIGRTESIKTECINAETGVRGYVVTKDKRFLEPYHTAKERLPELLAALRDGVKDDSSQGLRSDSLAAIVSRRMTMIENNLARFEADNPGVPVTAGGWNNSLDQMDSVRRLADGLETGAMQQMDNYEKRLAVLMGWSKAVAIISLGIVFAALLYSFITFNSENKARKKADNRANSYRMDLEYNKTELEEKNMELKQLRDVEKFTSTGRIARTIAHEVRNPLTNILLATEQLQELEGQNPQSQQLLQLINRNATRINQLVSELLDATRFVNLNFEKVDVNKLLEETLDMAKDRIGLQSIRVEKSFYPGVCNVNVDPEKIKVAFLNIIVNAVEAMEQGKGVLEIKTHQQGNTCVIEFRDNGKGMDEETLQKLFEPYYTDKPKGNGLGLTNTQNIILNHKGKIDVTSSPGNGAVFILMLDCV